MSAAQVGSWYPMARENVGGPAFPTRHPQNDDTTEWVEAGMTLRDYFAGQAMLGCLSEYVLTGTTSGDSEAAFAAHCYRLADAMLAERIK